MKTLAHLPFFRFLELLLARRSIRIPRWFFSSCLVRKGPIWHTKKRNGLDRRQVEGRQDNLSVKDT